LFFYIIGGCLFDELYTSCGYSQAEDDDFNWEQVNTLTKPTSDPWMPSGLLLVFSFLFKIEGHKSLDHSKCPLDIGRVKENVGL
jgi:hypothetical protein